MRSAPIWTGVSGSRLNAPFKLTRPPRISSLAFEREQKPSFESARARPTFLSAWFEAFWFEIRFEDGLWRWRLTPVDYMEVFAYFTARKRPTDVRSLDRSKTSEGNFRTSRRGKLQNEEGTTRPSPTA